MIPQIQTTPLRRALAPFSSYHSSNDPTRRGGLHRLAKKPSEGRVRASYLSWPSNLLIIMTNEDYYAVLDLMDEWDELKSMSQEEIEQYCR